MNTKTILCIVAAIILIGIVIRLVTNDGKLMEQYRQDLCQRCQERYNICINSPDKDREGGKYCKTWAGDDCYKCALILK